MDTDHFYNAPSKPKIEGLISGGLLWSVNEKELMLNYFTFLFLKPQATTKMS